MQLKFQISVGSAAVPAAVRGVLASNPSGLVALKRSEGGCSRRGVANHTPGACASHFRFPLSVFGFFPAGATVLFCVNLRKFALFCAMDANWRVLTRFDATRDVALLHAVAHCCESFFNAFLRVLTRTNTSPCGDRSADMLSAWDFRTPKPVANRRSGLAGVKCPFDEQKYECI